MKKILAIAIATAISAPAMADLTIGGSMDYRLQSTDGDLASGMESNIDFNASSEADNGMFIKAYIQLEQWNADGTMGANAAQGVDVDDNFIELGNATASVKLGSFVVPGAWATGDDDWQVAPAAGDRYQGHNMWLGNGFGAEPVDTRATADAQVTLNVTEGVQVVYSVALDSGATDDAYQLYASADLGGVVVKAELEDTGATAADEGFAVSAATTVSGVALNVSYAKNEADTSSAKFMASYNGFELNVQNDDYAAGTDGETSYFGSYKTALPMAGASLTLGAGAGEDSDTFGARIDYKF